MIDIAELTKEDIGKWVVYTAPHGETEKGRIKSWNDNWVFVVYKCDHQWDRFQDFTGCSTNPEDLEFTTKGALVQSNQSLEHSDRGSKW